MQSTNDQIRTWMASFVSDFLAMQIFLIVGAKVLWSLLMIVIFLVQRPDENLGSVLL